MLIAPCLEGLHGFVTAETKPTLFETMVNLRFLAPTAARIRVQNCLQNEETPPQTGNLYLLSKNLTIFNDLSRLNFVLLLLK